MEPAFAYREVAQQLGEAGFVRRFGGFFLLRTPPANALVSPPIAYRTARGHPKEDTLLEEEAASPEELRVAAIRKRPQNPFPERITVGRAPNCDIVLRVAFVSKVHATFHTDGGALRLSDNQSANGTKVNGVSLGAATPLAVAPGDVIAFGAYQVELVDGQRLYRALVG